MKEQKVTSREFNRLYSNLIELHRRVFDSEHEYPQSLCAKWFVKNLMAIIQTSTYRKNLSQEQVEIVLEKSINLLRTKLLDDEHKQALISSVRELRKLKSVFEVASYSK